MRDADGVEATARYLARRLIRVAVEDVGLADPLALRLAVAAKEAYEALGSPEGELALVEAAVYLALAPKSNSLYAAWKKAQEAAKARAARPWRARGWASSTSFSGGARRLSSSSGRSRAASWSRPAR